MDFWRRNPSSTFSDLAGNAKMEYEGSTHLLSSECERASVPDRAIDVRARMACPGPVGRNVNWGGRHGDGQKADRIL